MRAHIIENGIVVNTIEVQSLDVLPGLVDASIGGAIGDRYEDGNFVPPAPPPEPSQFHKDESRYKKRAAIKDELIAYMAADNMSRVRSGAWSVADLTTLLDDPHVIAANALMGTLSFELAAAQIQAATTPLLTPEIKADWTSRLQAHFYLEG